MNRTATLFLLVFCLVPSLKCMEVETASEWYDQAERLFDGQGVPKNIQASMPYYKLFIAESSNKKLVARAHSTLGEIYYTGVGGVTTDDAQAHYHFHTAVLLNADLFASTASSVRLGEMFLWGEYLKQDYEKAFTHLTFAATQKEFIPFKACALFYLGEMHYFGHGIPKNPVTARECFLQVINDCRYAHATADACWRLGELLLDGDQDVPQNIQEGVAYLRRAAGQSENTRAQRAAMARMANEYHCGKRIPQNLDKALELYLWVAQNRRKQEFDYWALARLGELLYKLNNKPDARKYLTLALDQTTCPQARKKALKLLASLEGKTL